MPTIRATCHLLKINAPVQLHGLIDAASSVKELYSILRAGKAMAASEFKFSVGSPPAQMAVGQTSQAMTTSQPGELYDVRLVSVNANNVIGAIKVVRSITGLGLREAKDLVDARGQRPVLASGVDLEKLNAITADLDAVGAKVSASPSAAA